MPKEIEGIGQETISIGDARKNLTKIPARFKENPALGAIAITKRGQPIMALVDWNLFESILETMEIMSDPELMKHIRQGIREMERGDLIPWEQVKSRLKL